jgi:lipopolysaccharide export LptBFGC system permease protein LptF
VSERIDWIRLAFTADVVAAPMSLVVGSRFKQGFVRRLEGGLLMWGGLVLFGAGLDLLRSGGVPPGLVLVASGIAFLACAGWALRRKRADSRTGEPQ